MAEARWADAALAGRAGADFTCRLPRLGLVGDVGCARPSPWRCALTWKMMPTSPCLRARIPAAVIIRERRPGAAPASRPSGGARQGAGGAQEAGMGAPPGLVRFEQIPPRGAFKLSQGLIS